MFAYKFFLFLLLVGVSLSGSRTAATPTSRSATRTLKFARRLNITGFSNIADADRARAKTLRSPFRGEPGSQRRDSIFSVSNWGSVYTASVGVGSPATQYDLVVDTGSSFTWVGANTGHPYVHTSTSKNTGQQLTLVYGEAYFSGTEYTDRVTLSPDLVIESQTIGVASTSKGVPGDGILGLGPVDLTLNSSGVTVPTVTNNLFTQRAFTTESLGIYFVPITDVNGNDGELSFGGPDSAKVTGDIGYVPITHTSPSNRYWGIDMSISYGSTSIMGLTAGIVDTGNTFVLLPNSAYDAYTLATGAIYDSTTTMLTISASQYATLLNLDFNIGSHTYSMVPNAQIWPRSLNSNFGGNSDTIYLNVISTGTDFGEGFDFILGYSFLKRFYSVYDTTNGRIGFATTDQTTVISN